MTEKLTAFLLDASNNKTIQRDLTESELSEIEKTDEESDFEKAKQEAKIAARESALAKLAALGLTEEEIGAL